MVVEDCLASQNYINVLSNANLWMIIFVSFGKKSTFPLSPVSAEVVSHSYSLVSQVISIRSVLGKIIVDSF